MTGEEEVSTQCPFCLETITFVCELYSGPQSYIEDCEVCCRPIQISYDTDPDAGITGFTVERSG